MARACRSAQEPAVTPCELRLCQCLAGDDVGHRVRVLPQRGEHLPRLARQAGIALLQQQLGRGAGHMTCVSGAGRAARPAPGVARQGWRARGGAPGVARQGWRGAPAAAPARGRRARCRGARAPGCVAWRIAWRIAWRVAWSNAWCIARCILSHDATHSSPGTSLTVQPRAAQTSHSTALQTILSCTTGARSSRQGSTCSSRSAARLTRCCTAHTVQQGSRWRQACRAHEGGQATSSSNPC